jgi:hypothetical protein
MGSRDLSMTGRGTLGAVTTYRRLRRLFRTIAASSLAAGAAGCDDRSPNVDPSIPEEPFDRAAFEADSCEETALNPAPSTDFVARRTFDVDHGSDGGVAPLPLGETALFGSPCATATEASACLDALAALPTDAGFRSSTHIGPNALEQYVFTQGDDAGVATNLDELRALLGTIDTVAEARLFLGHARPLYVHCPARYAERGIEILARSGEGCGLGDDVHEYLVLVRPDGTTEIVDSRLIEIGDPNCVIGRLTEGASPRLCPTPRTVGEHLAKMASLEAASVVAFSRLAAEMEAFGAPDAFVRRARSAARDEVRHTAIVEKNARRYGASMVRSESHPLPLRGRFEVALENAREGMVRETYGALAATYHASAATDAAIGRMFARIAADETRHASLAMDFGSWLEPTLRRSERAEVERAREEAASNLADVIAVALEPEVHDTLGWPRHEVARELVAQAFPASWS